MKSATSIARWSVLVGVVVLTAKVAAWRLTGSAALFSDAAETVVNVAASLVALWALHVAERPADREHPFGHAKAEFLAAGAEGALIVLAAISILREAWIAWQHPHPMDAPLLGLGVNAGATALNLAWALVLRWASRKWRSPALAGDARHLESDVLTSAGVAIGVGLVIWTGAMWLDAAVAAATALSVLYMGLRLIRSSAAALMDEAPDESTMDRIRAIVRENATGALEAHDLRTRHAGRHTFLDFHLVVPGEMKVAAAHEICDRIEAAFRAEMDHLTVSIHVEPENKAKHHGVVVV